MQRTKKNLAGKNVSSIGGLIGHACRLEPLEGRTLLSASWQTVDDFQLAAGKNAGDFQITSDPAGNVFATGTATDASGQDHQLIREKLNGVAGWSNIVDVPFGFRDTTVNAAGDIYVVTQSNATILERPAGQTTFNTVDQNPPIVGKHGVTTNKAGVVGLAIDANKNVFALEAVDGANWVVRKQSGGVGAFTTVNTFSSNLDGYNDVPEGITAVTSGTAQGLYEIGSSSAFPSHSIVRRSTDGGTTWSTIDTFQYSTGNNGWVTRAYAIAGDANGHVCITGPATTKTLTGGTKQHPTYSYASYWLTREGTVDASGKWTWAVVDALPVVGGDEPSGVGLDGNGNIFTVGTTTNGSSYQATFRSNLGGTWQTDNYQLAAGQYATYGQIAADASGNVYAGAGASDSQGIDHWIVRSAIPDAAPAAATNSLSIFSSVPIARSTDDSFLFSQSKDESLFAL